MPLYEFRLDNRRGSLILLYQAVCDSDARALERMQTLAALPYDRLEMWKGDQLLVEQDLRGRPVAGL